MIFTTKWKRLEWRHEAPGISGPGPLCLYHPSKALMLSRRQSLVLSTAILGLLTSSLKASSMKAKRKVGRVRKCVCYSNVGKLLKVFLIQRTLFLNNNTIEIQKLTFPAQERHHNLVCKYSTPPYPLPNYKENGPYNSYTFNILLWYASVSCTKSIPQVLQCLPIH